MTYTRHRAQLPIRTHTLGRSGVKPMNNTDHLLQNLEGIDFLDTLKKLTNDPAIHLLADLIEVKDPITNISNLSTGLSQVEKNKVSKGYKQLNQLGLVVRVKRGVYLLNPRLSPTYPEYFEKTCLHWIQLTGAQP